MVSDDRHCFVPGCTTGYTRTRIQNAKLGIKNKHLFKAKNQSQAEKWRRAIPRKDKLYQNHNAVCELHFADHFIIRYDETRLFNGTLHRLEKFMPILSVDAVPSIFPNLPKYLSKNVKKGRKCPAERKVATKAVCPSKSGNSDKRHALEADRQLIDVSRMTEAASPHTESFQAKEETIDSLCAYEVKPDVDTVFSNETEQMQVDRERIMNHPFECCRLCLERSDSLTDIIQGTELGLVIREAVKDLLNYEVVKKGDSPWLVCFSCMQRLSSFQEFKDRCIETKILWDDCSKYIDEKSSAYNTSANAIQPEAHSDSSVINKDTVNSLQQERNNQEESGNEMFSTPDGGITIASVCSLANEGVPINNAPWTDKDYEAIYQTEDVSTVMREPHDNDSSEMGDEEFESHLNKIHTQGALVNSGSSTRVEGKENSSANQVKEIYELDDSKGDDGEPLVIILKVDGTAELRTMSEIPPNLRVGMQKYSKRFENFKKKRP